MKALPVVPVALLAFATLLPAASKPGASAAAAAAEQKKEGVIPGMTIPRKDTDGFLGIQVVEGKFVLSFYDHDKQPVAGDYDRALLRWPVKYKLGDEREMLNANDDHLALTGPKFVRPPLNFQLYITLIGTGEEDAGDTHTYVVAFRQ